MIDKTSENTKIQESKQRTRRTPEERKAELLEKIKRHDAEKKKLEEKINRIDNTPERKRDTRKKILFGVTILEMMEKDQELQKIVMKHLDLVTTREEDRKLLGLAPRKK